MNLNNILYSAVYQTAAESKDGETSGRIVVTEEMNGYAVWQSSFDGQDLLKYEQGRAGSPAREAAIEFAVKKVTQLRSNQELAGLRKEGTDRIGPNKKATPKRGEARRND